MGGSSGITPSIDRALEPVRVLYIAGTGRSGSTLLGSIAGEVPGVFNAGELRFIWERGFVENRLCGCGERFHDCRFWQRVATETGEIDARSMVRTQAALTRIRHLPRLAFGSPAGPELRAYQDTVLRLYRAIAAVSGSDVVVDTSKLPSYARLLRTVPGLDLRVVHLVRDPRAAAGSWAGLKEQPDRGVAGTMQRLGPAHSALLWSLWNSSTRALAGGAGPIVTLRYEDFIAEPEMAVRRITDFVGLPDARLPFVGPRIVELRPNHTVAGNPDRLRSGRVEISRDSGSRNKLRGRERALVTALTLPVLVRYRYPVAGGRNGARPKPIGIQHLPGPLRTLRRVQRHLRWGREEGFDRLVEEDELDPRSRIARVARRHAWRRAHPIPAGTTKPVLLVGLQRSGTNMVARALAASPQFEVRNENDRAAFDRFRLRPTPVIRELVRSSGQTFLVLKPLIDSHRVDELLDGLKTPTHPVALWTFRSVDGRVRSALSKFGDHNLEVVRAIAEGREGEVWQGQRLSAESLSVVRALDIDRMTPETAAAVIWYLRNSLFFELALDARDDCRLVSYERLVDDPEMELRRICAFLHAEFEPAMAEGIARRGGAAPPPLQIEPTLRARCNELERRLEAACAGQQVAV